MRKLSSTLFFLMLPPGLIVLGWWLTSPVIEGAIARPRSSWQSVFLNWFSQEPKDRGSGGNSGGRPSANLCLITPDVNAVLWNTTPIFVWQGNYRDIGVRQVGADAAFWGATATGSNQTTQQLAYTGKALEPGKTYEWVFFVDANRRSPLRPVRFTLMPAQERTEMTKNLRSFEQRLRSVKLTQEEILMQRVNYFTQRGLKAEALQQIYSIPQPSPELQKIKQELESKLCQIPG